MDQDGPTALHVRTVGLILSIFLFFVFKPESPAADDGTGQECVERGNVRDGSFRQRGGA